MANMERHNHEVVYHYCAQCGRRRPLSEMSWQLGALICNDISWCFDTELIGSSERTISRILQNSQNEMQPDKKLQSPAAASSGIEEIIL